MEPKELPERDGRTVLQPVGGPPSGFRNLVAKENAEWAAGPSLLAHAAIWILIVAVVSAVIAFVRGEMEPGYTPKDINDAGALMFFVLGSVASVIAVVAKTQGAIIGEKQLGTAAWVLSKPASRRALPGRNFGTLLALILMVVPVRGLRPLRAARLPT